MTSRRLLTPTTKAMLEAADYIEQHGWCCGYRRSSTGTGFLSWLIDGNKPRVCADQAIAQVTDDVEIQHEARRRFKAYLGIDSIPLWSDAPGRTKEQIVAAWREAALNVESIAGVPAEAPMK